MPNLSPKQLIVFNLLFFRYLLIVGPRRSGKTISMLHRICRHLFDVHNAKVLIVTKTLGVAKDAGVWSELVEVILPEWQAAGFLKYAPRGEPRLDGQTRTLKMSLINRYGEVVTVFLNSLEFVGDAEKKFKGRKFTCVAISEITNWNSRKIFEALKECLRGEPYRDRMLIADCNPDPDNAMWVHDLFYTERTMEGYPDSVTTEEEQREFKALQAEKMVVSISMSENPFITEREKQSLIASYRHDPDLMARYVHGLWASSRVDGFFANHFNQDIHVIGDCTSANEQDWEIIIPSDKVHEIVLGWDLGDLNPAVIFACKERDSNGFNHWSVIDEYAVENEESRMDDFLMEIIDKMMFWKKVLGRPLLFRHYSDHSSFNWGISAQATEHMTIRKLSMDTIQLQETRAKYAGATLDAIDALRRMLFEQRFFVSANCFRTIKMFKSLAPVASRSQNVRPRVQKTGSVHVWDALRYAVMSEEPWDIAAIPIPRANKARPRILSLA